MNTFLQDHGAALRAFADLSNSIGARPDYVQGGGGNTSVKLDGGLMAIKASGFRLSDVRPDRAYAVLDGAALRRFYLETDPATLPDVEKAGAEHAKACVRTIDGLEPLRPSVEAGFHSLLDRHVAHSHAVWANFAACSAECDAVVRKAFEGAGYAVGIVPYVDPGAQLTFAVRDELRRVEAESGTRPGVLFLQNHGVIAHDDDPDECLRLHEDACRRVAAVFGVDFGSFPTFALRVAAEGLLKSDCPFLSERIASGSYDEDFFLAQPLYPDQMVFLANAFAFGDGMPEKGRCLADPATGRIRFRMPESRARVILETLVAVVFVADAVRRAGRTLVPMGAAAQCFIAGWESEKYRRALSERK